jgi:hypothetical protein
MPSTSRYATVSAADLTERLKMTKEQAETRRDVKKNVILSKMQEKEDLFKHREKQKHMNLMVN